MGKILSKTKCLRFTIIGTHRMMTSERNEGALFGRLPADKEGRI